MPWLPLPNLLTSALFSMVTASSTRSPRQKVPVWSSPPSSSSISSAAPGLRGLAQFRLTTRFPCRMRCHALRPHGQGRAGAGDGVLWKLPQAGFQHWPSLECPQRSGHPGAFTCRCHEVIQGPGPPQGPRCHNSLSSLSWEIQSAQTMGLCPLHSVPGIQPPFSVPPGLGAQEWPGI